MNNTALRAGAKSANKTHMVFTDEEHERFYYEKLEQAGVLQTELPTIPWDSQLYTLPRMPTTYEIPHTFFFHEYKILLFDKIVQFSVILFLGKVKCEWKFGKRNWQKDYFDL